MWRFIAGLSAVRKTEWADKKSQKCMKPNCAARVYDSVEVYIRQYQTFAVEIKLSL